MAASAIKNPSVEICAMPAPFQGVLKGGQSIILSYTPAQLAAMCPSLDDAFVVTDLGSYSGATDDADFGPIADFSAAAEVSINDATNNGITRGITLAHTTSGTAGAGIGTGALFQAENNAGTLRTAGAVDAIHTSAVNGAEVSVVVISAGQAGALVESARFAAPASAVNSLYVSGSATGSAIESYPQGMDANCGWAISGKGSGALSLRSGAGTTLMSISNAGLTVYSDTQLGAGPVVSRPTGVVQVNSGSTTVTVTNTLVSATSQIWAQIRNATTNPVSVLNVIPGAGSFVINLSGDPGVSNARINFLVLNPNA